MSEEKLVESPSEKLGRDPYWYRFVPQDDITAKEVAELLVALAWAVDESVYVRLSETTRRNFVQREEAES